MPLPPPEDAQLFQQLLIAAHLETDPRWQQLAAQPDAVHGLVSDVGSLATQRNLQAEAGPSVQFVVGRHVFNLRPLVWPAVVAVLVHVTVVAMPALESPLLYWVDAADLLKELGSVYRSLSDDEIDVFGAVAALHADRELRRGLTNPDAHATLAGVTAWFPANDYEAPPGIPAILHSLVHKGALLADELEGGQSLYRPTFLGKKEDHG